MLISVILPVYKVERFIERCVLSVMCQSCHDFQLECIIVDDCSPDGSMAIVERMVGGYKGPIKFYIVRQKVNMGVSAARNAGIYAASGQYVFFMDSDDYLNDNCLQRLTSVLREHPEADIVKGNFVGRIGVDLSLIPPLTSIGNDTLLELLYMHVFPVTVWNALIRKQLIEQWNLFFKEGLIHEDILWSVQLYRHVNDFVFVPDVTYHYECNPKSIIGKKDDVPGIYMSHMLTVIEALLNSFDVKHVVSFTIFIVFYLVNMVDIIHRDKSVHHETKQRVLHLRNHLMKRSLCNFQIILAMFQLILYFPFSIWLYSSFCRHHYYKIQQLVYKVATLSNKVFH